MTWVYNVAENKFYRDGAYQFDGLYAGAPGFKNDPQYQCLKEKGALPNGTYSIGSPYNSPHTGSYTLALTPRSSNNMCGRDAFRIHGDSRRTPGGASNGCIVASLVRRKEIWDSGDRELIVK